MKYLMEVQDPVVLERPVAAVNSYKLPPPYLRMFFSRLMAPNANEKQTEFARELTRLLSSEIGGEFGLQSLFHLRIDDFSLGADGPTDLLVIAVTGRCK